MQRGVFPPLQSGASRDRREAPLLRTLQPRTAVSAKERRRRDAERVGGKCRGGYPPLCRAAEAAIGAKRRAAAGERSERPSAAAIGGGGWGGRGPGRRREHGDALSAARTEQGWGPPLRRAKRASAKRGLCCVLGRCFVLALGRCASV